MTGPDNGREQQRLLRPRSFIAGRIMQQSTMQLSCLGWRVNATELSLSWFWFGVFVVFDVCSFVLLFFFVYFSLYRIANRQYVDCVSMISFQTPKEETMQAAEQFVQLTQTLCYDLAKAKKATDGKKCERQEASKLFFAPTPL